MVEERLPVDGEAALRQGAKDKVLRGCLVPAQRRKGDHFLRRRDLRVETGLDRSKDRLGEVLS